MAQYGNIVKEMTEVGHQTASTQTGDQTMRPIFLLTALLMTSNASAVTEAECQAQGKSYIEALITRTGSFRKAHCRSKPVTLSDAQKSARVASAKAKHPGVRVSGHD